MFQDLYCHVCILGRCFVFIKVKAITRVDLSPNSADLRLIFACYRSAQTTAIAAYLRPGNARFGHG